MKIARYRKWRYIIPAALVAAPLLIAAVVVIGGGIVMLLWNWLLPPLFDWPRLTLWQGAGLLVLCRILFGRFGAPARRSNSMTAEERERFRQRFCRTTGGRQETVVDAQTTDAEIKR
jgi:hypothetical protein